MSANAAVSDKLNHPQIRGVYLNGDRYVHAADMVAWMQVVADRIVDETASEETQEGQRIAANVINVLATFTAKRAAV